MWITGAICVRMMQAVRSHPLYWTTLEGHCAAGHEKVFDYFRHFVGAVGQQPVITHAGTKTACNPVENNCGKYGGPAPEEKRSDSTKMGAREKNPHSRIPIGPNYLEFLAHGRGFSFF